MNETGEMDALAAEFVLGTLDGPERAQAQAVLAADQGFAAKVRLWERRLSELHLMVEPVEPEPQIWERIKAKMPAIQPSPDIRLPEVEVKAPPPPAPTPAAAPIVPDTAAPALPAAPTPPTTSPPPVSAPSAAAIATPSATISTPPAAPAATLSPAPAAVAPAMRVPAREPPDDSLAIRRQLRRWQAIAALLLLIVLAIGGLVAAWRYVPERVPPALHVVELLRLVGITVTAPPPARRPAPPESQFDE